MTALEAEFLALSQLLPDVADVAGMADNDAILLDDVAGASTGATGAPLGPAGDYQYAQATERLQAPSPASLPRTAAIFDALRGILPPDSGIDAAITEMTTEILSAVRFSYETGVAIGRADSAANAPPRVA